MKIKNVLIKIYVIFSIFTSGIIFFNYPSCINNYEKFEDIPSAFVAGVNTIAGGIFWPFTFPGMLIIMHKNHKYMCL